MKDILTGLNNKDYISDLFADYDIHFAKKMKSMNWQHYDIINKRYNFVIAKNRKSGEIHSILGFVPTYQFDSEIKNVEVWPCICKSRDDTHVKGLGVSLYYYMKSNIEIETISILGISEIALSIYKHWNFSTGKIEQYYLSNINQPEVLSSNREEGLSANGKSGWMIRKITFNEYDAIDSNAKVFDKISRYKSKNYYINRYFEHPIYTYDFYAIKNSEIHSIIIARECGNNDSKCLRIVDFIGDERDLINVECNLKELMNELKYEYIDFVVVGIQADILKSAGFVNRKDNPGTVIPNYFEPFLKYNIDLDYAFKTVNLDVKTLFYKANADQDRPNMI